MSPDHIAETTRCISRYLAAEEEAIPAGCMQHISSCEPCSAMVKRASELSAMLAATLDATLIDGGVAAVERSDASSAATALTDATAAEVVVVHRRRHLLRLCAAAAVAIIAVASWVTVASLPRVQHPTATWWMLMILFAGPIVLAFMTAGLESVSTSRVYKQLRGRELSGVCRGLASAFGIPVWVVRIAFVSLTFLKGTGLVAYLILDVLLPVHPDDRPQLLRFRLLRWWKGRRPAAA